MNFQVEWAVIAEQALAAIWLASTDRNAVTLAAHQIELDLATSPNGVGVTVFDTVREYRRPPIGVEFEVIDADRRVFVLTVWDTTHGRPAPTGN